MVTFFVGAMLVLLLVVYRFVDNFYIMIASVAAFDGGIERFGGTLWWSG